LFEFVTDSILLVCFVDLWNFNYAFNKLDQLAVPAIVEDAMENWGLVEVKKNIISLNTNKR
jgi:aminopeptidase N